ncbi:hypothetical protein Tco_0562098 [Tanacetum coccineum]
MMDDPNITMKEYIRLEEEKARKHGKVFNWETAKYGKIWYDEDIHDLRSVETEFPAIAFNDELSSKTLSREPTIWLFHRVSKDTHFLDLMVEGLSGMMLIKHRDAQAILDLDTPGALQFLLGGARRRMSWRQFILALGLHTDEEMQKTRFGAYWADTPSYTAIRDPILRLCHRGMDVDSVNVPYLLARYLRRFATGRKSGAHISVIAPELSIIDMVELDDPALVHAPPPPLAAARTIPQRMVRLEEDVHEIRETLAKQRKVISMMAHDFSRYCTWTTTSLTRMMDRIGMTYTSYSQTPREYTRRVRRRTDGANTSAAQQDPQQPDP